MILADENSNGIQFSKLIVLISIIIAIVLCGCAIFIPVAEMVAVALVSAGGGLATTAIVWNLKKSQSENIIKIYMGAYREILQLKEKYLADGIVNECDEIVDKMENNIINKIDQTIDTHLEDATSLIEKQEI